jgi:DNA-binding GntR family transcriptional regulator
MVASRSTEPAGPAAATQLARRPVGLGEEVYGLLFAQIMSLQIAPGARITIDALARDLGVSPTPVREALGRLENEGLIHKTHLVGYRAAPQLSRRQFDDLYDLRLLLEPYAAAKAAECISDESLAELVALGREMTADGQDGPLAYGRFAQLDQRFHDEIARAGGNTLVEEALDRLHTHVHLFRLMYHSTVTEGALREHAAIIAAFQERDGPKAARLMRAHIERSRARFAERIDPAP